MTRALWGNIVAVIDADSNVVEPGRNKISDKYLGYIQEELRTAVKKLDKLVTQVRDAEEGKDTIDADEAKKDAQAMTRNSPLEFSVGFPLALKKTPSDEAEVIALFVDLLSHGAIPRTEILRLGGSAKTYDQYLRYRFSWGDVGSRQRKRAEGRRKPDLKKPQEKVLISEFKVDASRLARELDTPASRKQLGQIDLLVCWSEGPVPRGWRLTPLDNDERFFSTATHRLVKGEKSDEQNSCECLVLEEFLKQLEEKASS